jgi:hypothetical protein
LPYNRVTPLRIQVMFLERRAKPVSASGRELPLIVVLEGQPSGIGYESAEITTYGTTMKYCLTISVNSM